MAHERRWYRSLYGRIAIGFVVAVAMVIAVQAMVVLWLANRTGATSGPPPPGFARLVAQDIGRALAADPSLDVGGFVRSEYEQRLYPFVVVLRDGRVAASDGAAPSPELVARARTRLTARANDSQARLPRAEGAPPRVGLGRRGREGLGLGGPPPAPVRIDGRIEGLVYVVPQGPFRRFGPTLIATGIAVLLVATVAMAVAVIRPVRRRLSELQSTARDIGHGHLHVRAREDGGDEVADLARAVNRMAVDLEARDRALADADRARRLLLADVSHELRTPLTSMRGYLETLAMPELSTQEPARERYLRIVSDETRRLEHIVDDLLDLARLDARSAELDVADIAVEELFGAVVARHHLDADARGVALLCDIQSKAGIVRGDRRRLEQALQNLVANALRHTPAGGTVSVDSRIEGSASVITVRDTGSGIAPEHLPHVFDRFYKADGSRTGSTAGSGLGLSIVKAVVDRHGGAVAVSSTPAGTTFELRWPVDHEQYH